MPEGGIIKLTFELRLSKAATEDQVEEWLRFAVLQNGSIAGDNPLINENADSFGPPPSIDWTYTGMIGRTEKFNVVKTETGERYSIRYLRERAP